MMRGRAFARSEVRFAEEITYYSHDLDDALDFAILDSDQLDDSAIWQRSHERVAHRNPDLLGAELHKNIIRDIIDLQVLDVVATSAGAIAAAPPTNAEEARRQPAPLIRYSEELGAANRELRTFFRDRLLSPRVAEVNRRAARCCGSVRDMSRSRNGWRRAARRIETKGCTGRCAITSPE